MLRDEILNILLAGRDTVTEYYLVFESTNSCVCFQTTNTITYALYMLAEHPEVFKRLRQEVQDKVGESRRPTHDDTRDMKYLRAVING